MITEIKYSIDNIFRIDFTVTEDVGQYTITKKKTITPYFTSKKNMRHGKFYTVDRNVMSRFVLSHDFYVMKGIMINGKAYGQMLLSEEGKLLEYTATRNLKYMNFGFQRHYF